ncbi:MAG: hypothetical protein Kow0068_15110 [Marinilabiliales bacterium]
MTAIAYDSTHFCQSDAIGYLEMIYDSIYPRTVYVEELFEEKMSRIIADNYTEDYDCGLLVFPNPTDGKITVKIDEQIYSTGMKIIITGSDGKIYNIIKVQDKNNEYRFDMGGKKPGVYYVVLSGKNDIFCVKKLIKSK